MPLQLTEFNEINLVHGFKIEVLDRPLLAKYIALLLLGYQSHIEKILQSQSMKNPLVPNKNINNLIQKISKGTKIQKEIEKRDGWIFQMISWIAVRMELGEETIYSQIPHDAPAQQGIDGLLVILDENNKLKKIIITEDKATENPRNKIQQKIFPEFKEFEAGMHDNKLVNRITGFLKYITTETLLEEIEKDIYRIELRKYRIGITHDDSFHTQGRYIDLFKDYDSTVLDADNSRRSADTFSKNNLRPWFEELSELIIIELENLKNV